VKDTALPAATLQTAGKKKPTVNAAATARVGITKVTDAMINESIFHLNRMDITVAAALSEGDQK
jgi:hypothetical protein